MLASSKAKGKGKGKGKGKQPAGIVIAAPNRPVQLDALLSIDLATALVDGAAGRAGNALWIYAALCTTFHSVAKTKLELWVQTLETCLTAALPHLPVLLTPPDALTRYVSEEARAAARAKREEAHRKVGAVTRLLSDEYPPDDWARLKARPMAEVERVGRKILGHRESQAAHDRAVYAFGRSPVVPLDQAQKLMTTLARLTTVNAAHGHEADLSVKFGGGAAAIHAAMQRRCQVCAGLGVACACASRPGGTTTYQPTMPESIHLLGGVRLGYDWCTLPTQHAKEHNVLMLLHAKPPCIDKQLVSLPRRDGADSEAYMAPDWLSTLATPTRTAPGYAPEYVGRNRRLLLALLRTRTDQEDAVAAPAALQVHALDRRLGRTLARALFPPMRMATAGPGGWHDGHGPVAGGAVTGGWCQSHPKVWLCKHPAVPDTWTAEGLLETTPRQMVHALQRVKIEDEERAHAVEAARRAQRRMWERMLALLLKESGVAAPQELAAVDARLPGAKDALMFLTTGALVEQLACGETLVDPIDCPDVARMAALFGVLDGRLAAQDRLAHGACASGAAYMYLSGVPNTMLLAESNADQCRRELHACGLCDVYGETAYPVLVTAAHAFDAIRYETMRCFERSREPHTIAWTVTVGDGAFARELGDESEWKEGSAPKVTHVQLRNLHARCRAAMSKAGFDPDALSMPPLDPISTESEMAWRTKTAKVLGFARATRGAALAVLTWCNDPDVWVSAVEGKLDDAWVCEMLASKEASMEDVGA